MLIIHHALRKSLTAEGAKAAQEKKSFTAKNAKDAVGIIIGI